MSDRKISEAVAVRHGNGPNLRVSRITPEAQ